jgi:hypothetical protein
MFSMKRVLRMVVPVASLVLGATLYAQSSSSSCAHPSIFAKVMQATGMAHIQPCQVDLFNGEEICHDPGHHCNVGFGPGKCQDVASPVTTCQCVR